MLNNTQTALTKFSKGVVKQARTRLTKDKKNYTRETYNATSYELNVSPNSFSLKFYLGDHGAFVDEGVKGKDPSKVSPNAKITGQQAPNSRFKFGTGTSRGKFPQFVNKLEKWAKSKNLRFRDDQGRFKKGSYKSMAYVVAGNIYNRGLKPSGFFTKAFESQFKNLPKDIIDSYALDMQDLLKFTTKK
jgi:hypothetical protein